MIGRGQLEGLVVHVQNDFLEAPALNITVAEAERRFRADRATCEAVLDALVDARVLARTARGAYVRCFPRHGYAEAHPASAVAESAA